MRKNSKTRSTKILDRKAKQEANSTTLSSLTLEESKAMDKGNEG